MMLVGCFDICNVDYWVRAFRNDKGCESGILLLGVYLWHIFITLSLG